LLVEEVIGGSFDEAVDHLARAGGGQMAKGAALLERSGAAGKQRLSEVETG
jgi:hypothetical protein